MTGRAISDDSRHMDGADSQARTSVRDHWEPWDWAAAVSLFLGTAAVVLWQNSRLAVLWDLSYILENSHRIAVGDLPYRGFPFPFAPGTFLIQALLIRFTGHVYFHHILYCAVAGGVATVLCWRIVANLLRGSLASFRFVAFVLSAPLMALGVYCVLPHPFYDPDCTIAILCCVLLLQGLERRGFPAPRAFVVGMFFIVPLFVKQNTGLAFLASTGAAFFILTIAGAAPFWFSKGAEVASWKRISGCAWVLAGMISGLGAASLLLHFTVGAKNYAHWTILYAGSRRLPRFTEMFAPSWNPLLLVWIAASAGGAFLLWRNHGASRLRLLLSLTLMAAPFAWPVLYLFLEDDPSERAERLLALWPLVLIVSLALAAVSLRRGLSVPRFLPFILVGTVQGAFLSQQLWGSTYAIWPLLMILLAGVLVELARLAGARLAGEKSARLIELVATIGALCIFISGGSYVASHERLNYADLSTGTLARSSLPALAGLSTRGPWIPEFEELVRYSNTAIPKDQGILMIPGEDLFYYSTGRRPRFPVLMFDHTVNPYRPEEIVEMSRQRNICWLIVKKKLQLNGEPVEDKNRLLELLRPDFTPVQSLANYEIYRRSANAACAAQPLPATK